MIKFFLSFIQIIALNSSKAAEGELYIDDGSSFSFQQGAYIHRRFVFSDGKLTSSNPASACPGNVKFVSDVVIGRIIVLGNDSGSKGALIEPSNRKVDVIDGPLWVQWAHGPTVMTIRKLNVRIADDWTIKIL